MLKENSKKLVYSIKITLKGSTPPIWRRVYVSADSTLAELHDVIQQAMGWHDGHLHEFVINGQHFTALEMMGDDDYYDMIDEADVQLNKIAQPKSKFTYLYDFGDDWAHEIFVEKIIPADEHKMSLPNCVKGKRACPPEDCGGIWGYADLLETLAGPPNKERASLIKWLGGKFNPETFDIDQINKRLKGL